MVATWHDARAMTHSERYLLPCVLAAVAATAPAQIFSHPGFSSASNLSLHGTAAYAPPALRLTDFGNSQSSWVWHPQQVPVIAGFDTSFVFVIEPPQVGAAGEGLTFTIHNDPLGATAYGGRDYGLGYGAGSQSSQGIRNALTLEIDTYQDLAIGDTGLDEISIHTRGTLGNDEGESYSLARALSPVGLRDGVPHSVRLRYEANTLDVFVDGLPLLTKTYSLLAGGTYANGNPAPAPTFNQGGAWVGFTATTGPGGLTQRADLLAWTWKSDPLTDPCYVGTFGGDLLKVNGTAGNILREVQLATYQPFSIELQTPGTFGPGAPFVLFGSVAPDPTAPGANLGFGPLCMPILGGGPTLVPLVDSFGLFGGWFPPGAAPHTVAVPLGFVTFPLEITLQAVIAASANPFQLGVTNGIDLRFVTSPAPTISTPSPWSALPGQPITVTVQNVVPGFTLTAGGTPIVPTSLLGSALTFPYPAGIACGSPLVLTNPDGVAASTTLNPVPTTGTVAPGSGPAAGNTIVAVLGTGFAPGTTATVGGVAAQIVTATATAVVLRTPAGTAGPTTIVLTTPGGCTASAAFTYL